MEAILNKPTPQNLITSGCEDDGAAAQELTEHWSSVQSTIQHHICQHVPQVGQQVSYISRTQCQKSKLNFMSPTGGNMTFVGCLHNLHIKKEINYM
jgi:hypothetical protein